MERSDVKVPFACDAVAERNQLAKARYDRYVCAVIASHPDPDMAVNEVAEWAIQLMLAADKRWEEYTKGGNDDDTTA
jgi:hypothetical protein